MCMLQLLYINYIYLVTFHYTLLYSIFLKCASMDNVVYDRVKKLMVHLIFTKPMHHQNLLNVLVSH